MTYSPLVLVTTGASRVPRVELISVTVAPGMTPPPVSTTVPVTVPVVICAEAGVAIHSATDAAARTHTRFLSLIERLLQKLPPRSFSCSRIRTHVKAGRRKGLAPPRERRPSGPPTTRVAGPDGQQNAEIPCLTYRDDAQS